jgi:hypothetical protein
MMHNVSDRLQKHVQSGGSMNVAWIIALTATAGYLSSGAGTGGAAAPVALSCAVATPAAQPLVFEPKVGLTPRRVQARGHLELTGCTSPDGTATYLRSGWASVRATAQVSCTSARQVRGSAVITWFGENGRPVGTSRLRVRADRLVAQRPADTLLTGTVTAGWLAKEPVRGGISPATAILGCATRGMATLPGSGRIVFG